MGKILEKRLDSTKGHTKNQSPKRQLQCSNEQQRQKKKKRTSCDDQKRALALNRECLFLLLPIPSSSSTPEEPM